MPAIVITSLSLCTALVYALYSFRKKRQAGRLLSTALLFSALVELFDLLALLSPVNQLLLKKWGLAAEGLLVSSWLFFSQTFARTEGSQPASPLHRLLARSSFIVPLAAGLIPSGYLFYSPDFIPDKMLFLGQSSFFLYLAMLLYLTMSLINLESTLLNAAGADRWKIKFEILGAGSFLAVLLFYYSHSLLYRSVDMTLIPVRSFSLIAAVAMIAYAELKRGNGVKVYVSKQMAYRSVVLMVIGGYLVWLGLIGEWVKLFGDRSQRPVIISFAVATAMALVTALLSESVRRRLKVFLHKNFYANKYDYRAQWLMFTDRLASAKTEQDLLISILSGFCETFGMQGAALFLLDRESRTYRPVICHELAPVSDVVDADNSLVKYMKEKQWVFAAMEEDHSVRPPNDRFLRDLAITFTIPLAHNGDLEGFIALCKPVNKNEVYHYEDYDLMKTLARQAFSAVLNLRLSEELVKAREMEAVGKVSAYVLHDLKNLVASLALMVENGRSYLHDPQFQGDMLQSLSSTVEKMNRLIARLKKIREKEHLQCETVDLLEAVYQAVALAPRGNVVVNGIPIRAHIDPDEMEKVFLNIIINALDATGGKGPVRIEVGEGEAAFIRISDQGCGMTQEFVNHHLFQPFKTTKKGGLGIGLYQCRQIVAAHGGKIEVASEPGRGSTFTVHLPIDRVQEMRLQRAKTGYN